ncbi:MAG: P22 phage major capsid protein family protein [Sneathiella sp.]|uniref:P22 phage major capsid protein family protein n=1 Tax=Sneathiella sp. TaxID=1964365 RepID=UPI003001D9BA
MNDFSKQEVVLFNMVVDGFDTDNTVAKRAAKFSKPGKDMQDMGDTVWRPSAMISTVVEGLDVSSAFGTVSELSVPATLSTITNVAWQLDAKELRNPDYMKRKARSGYQALSAAVNRSIALAIKNRGSLAIARTGALTGYDDIAAVNALMKKNDIVGNQTMILNPDDYNGMAGNIAARTLTKRSEDAYSEAYLGNVAGFETFNTAFSPPMTAQAATPTVNGAQRYVPTAMSTAATGEKALVDNRQMSLTISSTAGLNVGDKFNIPNVNALSHINKYDTGALKTFTILSVDTGTTMTISPPIVVGDGSSDIEDDYANCTAVAANSAQLAFLNANAANANTFFIDDSIEIFSGRLAFDNMPGVAVMRAMTDSGLEIVFAKGGDVGTGKLSSRLTIFHGATNLNPEMNGVMFGGQ